MNTANAFKKSIVTLGALALGVIASSAVHAQILLRIDISNPSAVTITATGLHAGTNVVDASSLDGVELLNFFSATDGSDIFAPTTSTLAATNGTAPLFDTVAVDLDPIVNSQIGLDIYRTDNTGSLTFDLGQPAFTGSLTLDLTNRPLPALLTLGNPTSGNIIAGYGAAPGAVIGQWQVVTAPEPSTWLLLLISVAALPLVRRLRRS